LVFKQGETMQDRKRAPEAAGWDWLYAVADPIRLHIVRSLFATAEATAADLARGLASPQTLRRHLEALVSTGIVAVRPGTSDGETPGRPATHFMLDPEVRSSVSLLGHHPSPGADTPPLRPPS
jgi:hypothetical protein